VFDAMLLDPVAPTMIDARNSLIAADMMRYGGANQTEIWKAFSQRGMGAAAAVHATTVNDTNPVPDFASPLGGNTNVTFDIRANAPGDPAVVANVYVGHYEKQVNPIADTNPATVNSGIDVNLDASASFVSGEYDFLVVAKGYGAYRFSADLKGANKTIKVKLPANWASSAQGATATGDGTGQANAIDETELTNWSADGRAADGTLSGIAGKQITIDLAGTAAREIKHVQVSAMIGATDSRFAALRSFELWACNAAAGADCSTAAGFTKVYTSAANAFPGDAPRPIAPELILRDFQVPKFKATHLQLRVATSQCTGGPAYQGDQELTPANTDCDTGVSAASTRRFVRTAEIQAFTDDPTKD
jgi:hypothetical protein